MPEYSYIDLACKKLETDPGSVLAFHEYDDYLAIITSEGKKFTFSFKELEEFCQTVKKEPEKPKTKPTSPANSRTKTSRSSRNTKTKQKIDPEKK